MKKEKKYTLLAVIGMIIFFSIFITLQIMRFKESDKYFSELDVVLEGEIYKINQGSSGGFKFYYLKINQSNYKVYKKEDYYGRYYLKIYDEKATIYDGLGKYASVGDIIKLNGNLKTLIVLDSLGEVKLIKREFHLSDFLPEN